MKFGIPIAALLLAMLPLAALAQTQPAHPAPAQTPPHFTPFSADLEEIANDLDGTKRDIRGKMYVSRPHVRMDMQDKRDPGHPPIIILLNSTTKTMDMLYPEQHKYMEINASRANPSGHGSMPTDAAAPRSNPCAERKDVTCKNLGTEQVNGRTCDHWQVTDKGGNVTNVWLDKSLHIAVKTVGTAGSQELTNIKEGEQPASLFQIPAGYRKIDLTGMLQGRPPQR